MNIRIEMYKGKQSFFICNLTLFLYFKFQSK